MGVGGIGIWQLLVVLVIVVMLFGSKRIGGLGSDLGSAIRGFRQSVKEEDKDEDTDETTPGLQPAGRD